MHANDSPISSGGQMQYLAKIMMFLLMTLFSSVYAQSEQCISEKDFKEVAKNFTQYNRYLSSKTQYCASDMDEQWFKVAQSLVLLKNSTPDEPALDIDDALTYKAITEKDWWSYFTKRAQSFKVDKNCQEGVVAYVYGGGYGRGNINVCEMFFDISISSQASTMMHEVRHFDGHRHVTCRQGNEEGSRGACDTIISGRGSYAISVQTIVALARSKQTAPSEKGSLEAEAVYMAFNKFNEVPKVKLEDAMILSNDSGEVYRWVPGQNAKLIKTLKDPSIVTVSGGNLTIYPTDASIDAYRMDGQLTARVANPGLYAKSYNGESNLEREKYKTIAYLGTGGLLKDNTLLTLCSNSSSDFGKDNLDSRGQFSRIISLPVQGSAVEQESFLLNSNGSLLPYKCAGGSSSNGVVMGLNTANRTLTTKALNLPIDNKDWISATPLSKAEVF
jgi:hypothetical protein